MLCRQWRTRWCALRASGCMLLLCFHRCIYCRGTFLHPPFTRDQCFADVSIAHVFHPLCRRRIPLGLCNSWAPLRPHPWILHRFSQLLRMDIRSRLDRVHSFKRGSADVRRFSSRPRHRAMACLYCFRAHNLVLLRACHFWQPGTAILESGWTVPDYCRRNCDHHRGRSDAQGARS